MPGIDVTRIVEPAPQPSGTRPADPHAGQASTSGFRDALTQAQPAEADPAPPAAVAEHGDPPPEPVILQDEEQDAPEGAALAAISAAIVESLPPPAPVNVEQNAAPPVRSETPVPPPTNAPVPPPAWEGLNLGETPRNETTPVAVPFREFLPETGAPQNEETATTSTPAVPTTPVGRPPVELTAHWSHADSSIETNESAQSTGEPVLPQDDIPDRAAPLRGRVPPPEILASFTSPELPVAQRVSVATTRVPREALPEVVAEVLPPVPPVLAPETPRPVRVSIDADLPAENGELAIETTGTEGVDPFVVVENSTDSNETDNPTDREPEHDLPGDANLADSRNPELIREASDVALTADAAPAQLTTPVREPSLRESRMIDHIAPQLAYGLQVATAAAGQSVRVQLDPPDLGRVQLDVTITRGTVTAHVSVESAATQRLLNDNLPLLRDALTQQGVALDRLVVESHGESLRSDVADRGSSQSNQQQQQDEGRQWFLDEAETSAEPRQTRARTGRLDVTL